MHEFIDRVLDPHFATVFVLFLFCLSSGWPLYESKVNLFWILWFLAAVLCFVVCIKLAFGV